MTTRPPTPGRLAATIRRWLRSLRRADRLPISGLPPGMGELPSGRPALLFCPDASSRAALLQSLVSRASSQRPVTWVCAPERVPELARSGTPQEVERRRVRVLTWTEDASRQLHQLGAVHLMSELAAGGMHAADLLVIDALEPWLAAIPADAALEAGVAEAARLLARCAREHRGPFIALAPVRYRGQALLPLLARGPLSRLAALELGSASGCLDVFRWESPRSRGTRAAASLSGTRFDLGCTPQGGWRSLAATPFDARAAFTAADAGRVHAVCGALRDAPETPAHWHVHASLDALLAATTDAVAATVVLVHDRPDALPALAHAVHRLRREHPYLLKIVVRETGAAMRRNGEVALLRLGANVVLERHLGFPFLVQHVEGLTEAMHGQAPAPDLARTLLALAPEPVQGYLPPLDFCALVERTLERAAAVRPGARDTDARIEHSLVHLPLLPHVAHLDALLACNPRRHGDIVTADARGLYLFLFGCAADDVLPTLDAFFSLPCAELAQHVRIDPDAAAQERAIAQLRQGGAQAAVDFSAVLRGLVAAGDGPGCAPPSRAPVPPARGTASGPDGPSNVLPLGTALA